MVKTFLVTFIHDNKGSKSTTIRNSDTLSGVKKWVRMTKTFYIDYKIEEMT